MASEALISVAVCYSAAARQLIQVEVRMPHNSTVADAVRTSHLLDNVADADVDTLVTGVWGRKVSPDHPLRDGDRVELYRPLKVDPKMARRERFTRQGARGTGLFSKRRAGAKSGY
ncbi:RnfH family protein [Rhodoferax sp. GW822-FHT02A01]|uniref:RnfH family protein n=1 Tax=Rhodoferax sp. GW822-FHT02A01 TaxID=3141537 RepID=UPI00315D51DB